MWNEITGQLLYTDRNRGGVALSRHAIERRAYIEKNTARRKTEQRAATTGILHGAARELWTRVCALTTGMRPAGPAAPQRRAELPAE